MLIVSLRLLMPLEEGGKGMMVMIDDVNNEYSSSKPRVRREGVIDRSRTLRSCVSARTQQ